jgi:hypothetical protein
VSDEVSIPPSLGRLVGLRGPLRIGSHIGSSPSSRYAAATLRFARFAVTAPFRRGAFVSMIVAVRSRP